MGFVSKISGSITISGNTSLCSKPIFLSWTKVGREYLIGKKPGRKKGILVKYISLGDSDTNYFNTNLKRSGYIPNISGQEDECINGTWKSESSNLINLNKVGLSIVKDFIINLDLNSNVDITSCNLNDLKYDLFINSISVFSQLPDYYSLFTPNVTYNSINEIQDYYVNTFNFFLPSIKQIISVDSIRHEKLSNTAYKITGVTFKLNTLPNGTVLSDSAVYSCNNSILSNITDIQKVIINPQVIDTVNAGSVIVPDCSSFSDDCSIYYSIDALDMDVDLSEIYNCIVSEFDGWV